MPLLGLYSDIYIYIYIFWIHENIGLDQNCQHFLRTEKTQSNSRDQCKHVEHMLSFIFFFLITMDV